VRRTPRRTGRPTQPRPVNVLFDLLKVVPEDAPGRLILSRRTVSVAASIFTEAT
jgi:hypothetical protein